MNRNTTPTEHTFEVDEFVEIEYTARVADDGTVVDTTDSSVAAESGLDGVDAGGPIVVVLGAGHLFGPVEEAITEMRPGERRTVEVTPASAFGETDLGRRHTVAVDLLSRDSIEQNDRVSIDGRVGYVDAVDDGTVTLDFNHPLAGTTLEYELLAVDRIVELDERIDGLLRLYELRNDVAHTSNDGVVECTVTRSLIPGEKWYGRKQQFLDVATRHLDVDEIRVEERYTTA
jgi:FKBP-type peptidyl-prolyl cis-trans isomerase 2